MRYRLESKGRTVDVDEDLQERRQELARLDRTALDRLRRRFKTEIPPKRLERAERQPIRFRCHRHFREHLERDRVPPKERPRILGDHHPDSGQVNVDADRPDLLRTVTHERLHQVSDGRFRGLLGRRLDEGMTERLTDQIARADGQQGPRAERDRVYPRERRLVDGLAARIGDAPLRQAYFRGDWSALRERVNRKLGDGALERLVELSESEKDDRAEALIRHGL